MKRILTHLAAFIAGIIALPLGIFITVKVAPNALPGLFSPNVSLAKDLIEKGERDTVVEYFEACRKFWRMDRGRLDDWIALVKGGETPYFGGNLRY